MKPKAVEEMSVEELEEEIGDAYHEASRDCIEFIPETNKLFAAAVAELARRARAGEEKTGKDGKR